MSEKEQLRWSNLIHQFESEIKSGKGFRVLVEIKKLKNIPMDMTIRLQLSNILRRLGEYSYSLILLKPLLKNIFGDYYENKFYSKELVKYVDSKSEIENKIIISYAASLRNIGCTEEAITLLDSMDENKYPELLLQKAISYFKKWSYFRAIPLLKKYILANQNDPYQKLVGLVNIAAAYTGLGKYQLSNQYILKAKKIAKKLKAYLLLGNLLEIEIQNMFYLKKFEPIHSLFEQAHILLKNSGGPYLLYLNKWKTLSKLHPYFEEGMDINKNESSFLSAQKDLQDLKTWAIQLRNWETVRDVDYYISLLSADFESLKKISLLTPHLAFKTKIKKTLSHKMQPASRGPNILTYDPTGFLLHAGSKTSTDMGTGPNQCFDLVKWSWNQQQLPSLKKNSSFYLLISSLIKNPYRDHSLGVLFSEIYPHQVFDPVYSVERIKKVISRCNHFMKKNGIPLQIKSEKSFYSIVLNSKVHFIFDQEIHMNPEKISKKNYLKILWDYQCRKPYPSSVYFSNILLKKLWSCSDRQARRIARDLVQINWLISLGSGRGQKYQLIANRHTRKSIQLEVSST